MERIKKDNDKELTSFINVFTKIFSKEKCNLGRQTEIDLLRGFTIIILIVCHVGLYLTLDTNSPMYYFCDLIGSEPAAPVFMILMGVSMIFSKKQNAMHYLKRGIVILILSIILNLLRSFPYLFTKDIDYFACKQGFFVIDILQFASVSFLLFAFFKAIKTPVWCVFIISVIFLITGQVLMSIPGALDFSQEAKYILNLFLPINDDWCCFNFLTWFIYPCFGLLVGEMITRCKNKDMMYLILLIIGFIGICILYINIIVRFPDYTSYYYGGNFYRMGILNTIVTILCFCFFLSIWHFLEKILPKIIIKYFTFLSKNITLIYFISWIEISLLIHLQAIYNIEFSVITIIGIILMVILTCSFMSIIYDKIKKRRLKNE